MLLPLANVPLKLRCGHNERLEGLKVSDTRYHVFIMYVDRDQLLHT